MKTNEILLWLFIGIIVILTSAISSYFKYTYRRERLKYVQENTDDKTFAKYLIYKEILGIISVFLIVGYLAYMSKINRRI